MAADPGTLPANVAAGPARFGHDIVRRRLDALVLPRVGWIRLGDPGRGALLDLPRSPANPVQSLHPARLPLPPRSPASRDGDHGFPAPVFARLYGAPPDIPASLRPARGSD